MWNLYSVRKGVEEVAADFGAKAPKAIDEWVDIAKGGHQMVIRSHRSLDSEERSHPSGFGATATLVRLTLISAAIPMAWRLEAQGEMDRSSKSDNA